MLYSFLPSDAPFPSKGTAPRNGISLAAFSTNTAFTKKKKTTKNC